MYIKNIITNKNCKVFKKVHFAMVLAVSIKKKLNLILADCLERRHLTFNKFDIFGKSSVEINNMEPKCGFSKIKIKMKL